MVYLWIFNPVKGNSSSGQSPQRSRGFKNTTIKYFFVHRDSRFQTASGFFICNFLPKFCCVFYHYCLLPTVYIHNRKKTLQTSYSSRIAKNAFRHLSIFLLTFILSSSFFSFFPEQKRNNKGEEE